MAENHRNCVVLRGIFDDFMDERDETYDNMYGFNYFRSHCRHFNQSKYPWILLQTQIVGKSIHGYFYQLISTLFSAFDDGKSIHGYFCHR